MDRALSIACIALAVLGASQIAAQQEPTAEPALHRATWTFDPVKGTMQATPAAVVVIPGKPEAVAETTPPTSPITHTGTVDITLTINLVSAVPKGALLRCSGSAALDYSVESTGISTGMAVIGIVGGVQQSSESVDASVSGATATCKFAIPYSWTIPGYPAGTTVTVQGITGSVGVSEDILDSVTGANVLRVVRSTTKELTGPATMPADGTTTKLTASTVL
jgi:hypothetical protein